MTVWRVTKHPTVTPSALGGDWNDDWNDDWAHGAAAGTLWKIAGQKLLVFPSTSLVGNIPAGAILGANLVLVQPDRHLVGNIPGLGVLGGAVTFTYHLVGDVPGAGVLAGTLTSASPVLFTYNFLTSPSMPTGLSLSRATVGSYWDSSGVLQSAAINAARFGNAWNGTAWVAEGLLVEEQRTNYIEEADMTLSSFNWREPGAGFASVTSVAGLDGTSSAFKFVPSTSNGAHMVYHISVGPSSSSPVTHSVYAKPNGYTKLAVRDTGSTGGGSTSTQLLSGAGSIFADNQENSVVITSKIGARGSGGWYRCMATFTPPGSTQNTLGFLPLDASFPGGSTDPWTGYNYVGDGTSGITLNFPQHELGAFPTSIIFPPPSGGPVTRSADLVSASGTLATQLAAGPSVWEMQDQATGVISRTSFAAGAFTFPTSKLYRSFGVYPSGTNTAPYLTVGGPY